MTPNAWIQIGVFLLILLAAVRPLGAYMAAVYEGRMRWLGPLERWILRLCDARPDEEQNWRSYSIHWLCFHLWGLLVVLGILMTQQWHPWNPQGFGNLPFHTAFNIASSFVTNTNWQNYGGENTLSYFSQMAALTVQNFVSAAAGMVIIAALARGLTRKTTEQLGNFWVDLTRTTLYILLPLSLLLSVVLIQQGTIDNLDAYVKTSGGQVLPMGPAASQIAIKQLGTNGGGFFNANSAHPFENPTPLSNLFEVVSILLIPAALCYSFGRLIKDKRQGWALLATMLLIFVPLLILAVWSETVPIPNLEGKELRFGTVDSGIWAAATTAASNGSVNSMHDSFLPVGQFVTMFLMMLGEVVFGGAGSGLYGMVVFAIITVFIAGLMVGRTPEYMGKKIESFEMKMASIAILVPPMCVLVGTAVAVEHPQGVGGLLNHGPHGFSEILYAFTSMSNNNGSAFAGYGANTVLVNLMGGVIMLLSRFGVALPVLAIAGSLAAKKSVPPGLGTLPTHTPLFIGLLAGTVIIVGALAFLPALALGPVVEQLRMR
ncbi:potassium-transporting ATPase subunit KdpA [Bryobacter aggregatus]|uniref:potassium-transporting ATPase subunit KdpA n=1 Tax=Bryobacter aggregatus TaxID=360054 RepID=UPI0004E1E05A|nr:potassium-transporting ATPase subunit KdpA [Bryobacter aggregatus]